MHRLLMVAALLLVGCVEGPDYDAIEDARFASFRGLTMAQFSQRTGLVPYDYYDTNDGRVFLVSSAPRALVVPSGLGVPTQVINAQCNIQVQTKPTGGANADGWVIVGTIRQGICRNV